MKRTAKIQSQHNRMDFVGGPGMTDKLRWLGKFRVGATPKCANLYVLAAIWPAHPLVLFANSLSESGEFYNHFDDEENSLQLWNPPETLEKMTWGRSQSTEIDLDKLISPDAATASQRIRNWRLHPDRPEFDQAWKDFADWCHKVGFVDGNAIARIRLAFSP